MLYCGVSTGHVLGLALDRERLQLEFRAKDHGAPVRSIAATSAYLFSGDGRGTVVARSTTTLDHIDATFHGDGCPCDVLGAKGDRAYAGYASGIVRVLSVSRGAPVYQISAHCRGVSAVDPHPDMNIVRFNFFFHFFLYVRIFLADDDLSLCICPQ